MIKRMKNTEETFVCLKFVIGINSFYSLVSREHSNERSKGKAYFWFTNDQGYFIDTCPMPASAYWLLLVPSLLLQNPDSLRMFTSEAV
jgi:hypothetical protein